MSKLAKVLVTFILALLLALMLAVVGAVLAPSGQENAFFAIFFWAGLIGSLVMLLKVQRMGFWFCLTYAIGWALLPISAAINTTQPGKETGCGAIIGAMATVVFLAITIPLGAIGFILFLLLALLVFRKKKPTTVKPVSEGTIQH